jgi:hypothetical protein
VSHWIQWSAVLDVFVKVLLTVAATLYVRAKIPEMSQEATDKAMARLRQEIADRDLVSIGLREQILLLTNRMAEVKIDVERKEAQVMALLARNLDLDAKIRNLERKS